MIAIHKILHLDEYQVKLAVVKGECNKQFLCGDCSKIEREDYN